MAQKLNSKGGHFFALNFGFKHYKMAYQNHPKPVVIEISLTISASLLTVKDLYQLITATVGAQAS